MKLITIILNLLILFSMQCFPQRKNDLSQIEDTLAALSTKIIQTTDDSIKMALNLLFREKLSKALINPFSFNYPFDSLKTLGKISSPDKKFRIYNWNLPYSDGTNHYFAIIHVKQGKKDFKLFVLKDKSDSISHPETRILGKDNWYGALYYKVILNKSGQRDIYTMLGWDGLSNEKNLKLIEILTFDSRGNPVFGATIFRKFKTGNTSRVFFEYQSRASLMLKADEQTITSGKRWNASKRRYETAEENHPMIIFDHMVTIQSISGEDVMAPSDLYDGFIFKNGTWNFVSEIDARNR